MSAAVGLAVIGCDDVATTRHLPAIMARDDVALAAGCDMDADRAQGAMETFGAGGWTTDARDVLSDDTIDAVIVATPPWVGPRLTIDAVRAGKDVLCEKPMALSLGEARRVRDAERQTDRFVHVGFVLRHGPLFDTLRRWLAEDRLGSPFSLRISVLDEPWQPDTDPEHDGRILGTPKHGAPCIHDGAHTTNHLHYLLEDHATSLTAWGQKARPEFPRPNLNTAVMEFAAGHVARVEIGWFLPVFPPREWSIVGPSSAWLDQAAGRVELRAELGEEMVAWLAGDDWFTSCFRHQLDTSISASGPASRPNRARKPASLGWRSTGRSNSGCASHGRSRRTTTREDNAH